MDAQQAFANYDQELLGKSWEDLVFEGKEHWESLLARVQAGNGFSHLFQESKTLKQYE